MRNLRKLKVRTEIGKIRIHRNCINENRIKKETGNVKIESREKFVGDSEPNNQGDLDEIRTEK